MIKRLFLIAIVSSVCVSLALAQKRPKWITSPPPTTNKFLFTVVKGEIGEDLFDKAVRKARQSFGLLRNEDSRSSYTGNLGKIGAIEIGGQTVKYNIVHEYNGALYTYRLYRFQPPKGTLKKAYKNPLLLAVPLSAVVPGAGQFYKHRRGNGFFYMFTFFSAAGTATYFEYQRQNALKDYKTTTSFSERENLISKIKKHQNWRNISLGAAGVIYVFNLLNVIVSRSERPLAFNQNKPLQWDLAYNHEAQAPMVGMKIRLSGSGSKK